MALTFRKCLWHSIFYLTVLIVTPQCQGHSVAHPFKEVGNSDISQEILTKHQMHKNKPEIIFDYVDVGLTKNLTRDITIKSKEPIEAVVELAIFCSVDFSQIFEFSDEAIKDYFSVFLQDVTLRFRSLNSSRIDFRISSITIMKDPSEQPFIEDARDNVGRISMQRVLDLFSKWTYKMMDSVPKFDVAVSVLSTKSNDGITGITYLGGACSFSRSAERHFSTLVFCDTGSFNAFVGAHELGHVMGAPHDVDDNFPGGCHEKSYIMSYGPTRKKQYYFSSCSDRVISEFITSTNAQCLRQIDNKNSYFEKVNPPSRLQQCKRRFPFNDVYVDENDSNMCSFTTCYRKENNVSIRYLPISIVDQTPCSDDGHCFRDRCIPIGSALWNVGSNYCIRATDQFSSESSLSLFPCKSNHTVLTPLDTFSGRLLSSEVPGSVAIITPYTTASGLEHGDKCLIAEDAEGGRVYLAKCSQPYESRFAWNGILNFETWNYALQHVETNRCAEVKGSNVIATSNCDEQNMNLVWKDFRK